MSTDNTESKAVQPTRTIEEIKKHLSFLKTAYDPSVILEKAENQVNNPNEGDERSSSSTDPVFKAMTLSEFKNGILLVSILPEEYSTFAINMLNQLQEEYGCTTISEQATAELVTVNYVRTLDIENKIRKYLSMGTISDTGVKFLSIMSQELDRANRHYISSLEALKSLKQPNLGVNIKANTAVIGQNQIVQAKNNPNGY
jgi:hypothetical protein